MYSQKGSPVSGGPFFEEKGNQALIMQKDSFNSIFCRSNDMNQGKGNKL